MMLQGSYGSVQLSSGKVTSGKPVKNCLVRHCPAGGGGVGSARIRDEFATVDDVWPCSAPRVDEGPGHTGGIAIEDGLGGIQILHRRADEDAPDQEHPPPST